MTLISIYVITISIWLILLIILLFFKKFRPLATSFLFSTILLFTGLKIISNSYQTNITYQKNKKESFIEAKKKNNEISVNMSTSGWLLSKDGRTSSSSLSLDDRRSIGEFLPLGSAPNVMTFYCAEDDGFVIYKSDRFGFRNNDLLWNLKDHDILIIGGSFAESACIHEPLQKKFNTTDSIISLGKGGNGPLTSLAVLREYLDVYKPKTIYHFVSSSDYSRPDGHRLKIDLEREIEEDDLLKYLKDTSFSINYFSSLNLSKLREFAIAHSSKASLKKNDEPNSIILRFADLLSYSFLKAQIKNILPEKNNIDVRFIEKEVLISVYKEMLQESENKNINLKFVLLPDKYPSCSSESNEGYLKTVFSKLNSEPIDLRYKICSSLYFAKNGNHFNNIGYQKLVEIIENDFNKQQ